MHHNPTPLLHRAKRRVIACAVGRALCVMAAGAAVAAVAAPAVAQEADSLRNFAIPAGPLNATLNRFGREAGIMLSFSTQATQDKSTAPPCAAPRCTTCISRILT